MPNMIQMPAQHRSASFVPGSVNEEKRTIDLVWSTGAKVLRFDWMTGRRYYEELSLDPAAVRMGRLNNGAPFLDSHESDELDSVLGVVESASLSGAEGVATVRFALNDPDVDAIWNKISSGIIRNVSAGYLVYRYEKNEPTDGSIPTWLATDWEPIELSAVACGADAGAGFRSMQRSGDKACACEVVERVAEGAPAEPVEVAEDEPVATEAEVATEEIRFVPTEPIRTRLELLMKKVA